MIQPMLPTFHSFKYILPNKTLVRIIPTERIFLLKTSLPLIQNSPGSAYRSIQMASIVMVMISVCSEIIGDYVVLSAVATIFFIWKYDPYFANPAGPAARIDGGGGGREGEGQVREGGGAQMAPVRHRYLGTGALLRQCFRDVLDNSPGRARALPGLGRREGNKEGEADPSAWVVLKGRMVERWRAGLAELEVPLEWWSREWKGSVLLLGLVVLGSFVFDPDLSESQGELAEMTQTITVAEVPQKPSVFCKSLSVIS